MDTFALWVGYAVIFSGSVLFVSSLIFSAIYFATYFINCSHKRVADTVAGKQWLNWVIEEAKRRRIKS